jgi:hypothetical protein
MGSKGAGRVAIGPSTSVLVESLAQSFVSGGQLGQGDEVGVGV